VTDVPLGRRVNSLSSNPPSSSWSSTSRPPRRSALLFPSRFSSGRTRWSS